MLASCIHDAAVAVSATARCLKRGADVNARDAHGTTALMCAAREGDSHAQVVALLLAAGADPHIEEETQLLVADDGRLVVLELDESNGATKTVEGVRVPPRSCANSVCNMFMATSNK